MGIFDAFKKKPTAPLGELGLKDELGIPPPPPPPITGVSKELPAFPKFKTEEDKTPHLPPLSFDVKHIEKTSEVPKPPWVESILEPPELEKKFPNISPFELEPEPSLKEVETKKPELEKKALSKDEETLEEYPHYEEEVGEVKRALHKPEDFVNKPIFADIYDYKVVLKNTVDIKNSLNGLNLSITKTKDLEDKEEIEFKNWQLILDDMRKKFLFVDESLFESKG